MTQDLIFALRSLRKSPGFTLAAVLTLALGIGATTTVFSLVNRALLRPLPFPEADRLLLLWGHDPNSAWANLPLSYPNYRDVREQTKAFDRIGAWAASPDRKFGLTGDGEPQEVQYAAGSSGLFAALGAKAVVGRLLSEEDDQPGAAPVVILSEHLWHSRFGGDSSVVGRVVELDGMQYNVIGVLPRSFNFVSYPANPDLWLSLEQDPAVGQGYRSARYARGAAYLGVIGRLRSDITIEAALEDLDGVSVALARQYPEFNNDWSLQPVRLHEQASGAARRPLLVLLGAVTLVLLIACTNVANLLLVRASGRRREMAIRMVLGASRGRLLRQLMTESVVISLAGGVGGTLLATWVLSMPGLASWGPPSPFVPVSLLRDGVAPDQLVLGFSLLLSVVTGLAFGLIPALRVSGMNLNDIIKESGTATGRPGGPLRDALVVGEMAISMVLLVGAGLMLRSFARVLDQDPGVNPGHVLTMALSLPASKYPSGERAIGFFDAVLQRVRTLPGVRYAGIGENIPFTGISGGTDFRIEGRPDPAPGKEPFAGYAAIGGDYFRALGTPVLAGRLFGTGDAAGSPPVAVINQAMARRFWPGENPVGKRFALSIEALRFGADGPPTLDFPSAYRVVIGVVGDVRAEGLDADPRPEVFLPHQQRPSHNLGLVIRSDGEPSALTPSIQRAIWSVDPTQPVARVATLDQLVSLSLGERRQRTLLLGVFATLALALTGIGLYGVIAFSVAQRSKELSIRMALGASPVSVIALVIRRGIWLTAIGIGLGLAGSLAIGRTLAALLYQTSATDGLTLALVPLFLGAAALLASWLPARRAARMDPLVALRNE